MQLSPEITEHLRALLPPEGAVLDIGCGSGAFLRSLQDDVYSLLGVDPVDPGAFPERILFYQAEAESLPFADESMDVVVMQCVFSLCQPEKTVAEIKRVLKRSGRLLLADLYAKGESVAAQESTLLGRIERKEELEAYFQKDFLLRETIDETPALTQMYIQAIFEGDDNNCIACADLSLIKKAKCGYAIWVFERRL